VVCPPYDVISPSQQQALYDRSPYNLVRLELGHQEPDDDERDNRYTRAAATLERWRSEGVLAAEPRPALYLHEAAFELGGRQYARRDVFAAATLAPWEAGVVRPHERTMARPKQDRLQLLRATRTQISPVWMLYPGESGPLRVAWEMALARAPQQDFFDQGGVRHRLWAVSDPEVVAAVQRDFAPRPLYVADGHHRYETALAYQQERRDAAGGAPGPYDALLTALTSAADPGLVILPIHRLLRGLPAGVEATLPALLDGAASVGEQPLPDDPARAADAVQALTDGLVGRQGHHFVALGDRGRRAWRVDVTDPSRVWQDAAEGRSPAWRGLDVVILHGLIVDPLLRRYGLALEDAVSYTHAAAEALDAVRGGEAELALLVAPTRVEQVLAVSDARDRMPQKSTFFVPKLPSGLVLYSM
jgi:uncharacterized protein (DUF1015 family)